VLDFGCGGGFDMYVVSLLTGGKGMTYGVDLTEKMVQRARVNLTCAGLTNFDIREVDSENLPYADSFFDVVISNGVINLSPCKEQCLREIHRVLKPGGVLQFADVVRETELPPHMTGSPEAWSH
jgi:ubiquinone/menaquinone biosynthesis C-methylase UbiE